MTRLAAILALLCPVVGHAAGGHDGHSHIDGGHDQGAIIKEALEKNPELRQKKEAFEKRLKRQQDQNGGFPNEPPEVITLDPEVEDMIRRKAQELAAASDESFMADIIAEAEVEKAQLVEHNIWTAVEEKTRDGSAATKALYREYLRRVYFFGGGGSGPSAQRLSAYIKKSLETPRGWGGFPTVERPLHIPSPPSVQGLWEGGRISLKGLDIVVLSHEWHHHMDGSIEPSLDGQNEHPNPPWQGGSPPEAYAYANMGSEL